MTDTLVFAPNWVGDTVMALPVIEALAAAGRRPAVLARPHLGPLLETGPPCGKHDSVPPARADTNEKFVKIAKLSLVDQHVGGAHRNQMAVYRVLNLIRRTKLVAAVEFCFAHRRAGRAGANGHPCKGCDNREPCPTCVCCSDVLQHGSESFIPP